MMLTFCRLSKESSMSRSFLVSSAVLGLAVAALTAQSAAPTEKVDTAINDRIRAEGMTRSQIMRIEHVLTDVYGPRLTGSPNHKAAGEWAVKEMTSWGMKNGALEPFEWA